MNKKILIILLAIFIIACDDNKQTQEILQKNNVESMNEGSVNLISDIELKFMMDTVYKMYDDSYPKVELTVEYVNARKAMANLLAGESTISIISRGYLPDEDSSMKAFNVQRERMEIAKDALVFFAQPDYPIDTLNVEQIFQILTNSDENLKDYFPALSEEPIIAVADQNSSVYAHLINLAARGKSIKKNLKLFETTEQVKEFVKANPNSIGIGYLSHIVHNINFKAIRLGFHYENGKREMPQVVHQAYIVMDRYPYVISHYAYLLEDRRNLPWWAASFFAKETKVQSYFNKFGIVPAYAQFKLIKSD